MVTFFLGLVYTTINTQCIVIYPGKFKFIPVKISPDSGRLHCRHAKDNQTPATFFTAGNLSMSANTERIKICSIMLRIYPGKCIYTVIYKRIETDLAKYFSIFFSRLIPIENYFSVLRLNG